MIAEPPLAPLELVARDRTARRQRIAGGAVRRLVARLELGRRVVDGGAGDLAAPRARVNARLVAARPNGGRRDRRATSLEQVDDVLDERRSSRLEVADRPEPAEHLLAEAVGGRDRGGVEVGDARARAGRGAARPRAAARRRAARRPGRRAGSGAPASDARELAARHATSRSRTRSRSSPVAIRVNVTSSSSSSGDALGHVARGQRGDRVRLAGAGARLEHGHARSAADRTRSNSA